MLQALQTSRSPSNPFANYYNPCKNINKNLGNIWSTFFTVDHKYFFSSNRWIWRFIKLNFVSKKNVCNKTKLIHDSWHDKKLNLIYIIINFNPKLQQTVLNAFMTVWSARFLMYKEICKDSIYIVEGAHLYCIIHKRDHLPCCRSKVIML